MHDTNLEERLRSVLRAEGDNLSLTITTDELERRLALRRRARNGQRLSLMAAGIAVLAVGTMVALSNGWLRGTNVATDPSPSPAPSASASAAPSESLAPVATPSPAASVDPLAALPELAKDPLSNDYYQTEDPGQPTETDPGLISHGFDGVNMEAREAGVKIVCLGPDGAFRWGSDVDRTSVASETVVCDGTIQSFRYDVAAQQPMISQILVLDTTPSTPYRILVESFGFTNDPRPTALPSFAIPAGAVLDDVTTNGGATNDGAVALKAGNVSPRADYRVALVCLGVGTAQWAIGDLGERDFVATGVVDCDGSAIGFEVSEGVPAAATQVWVYTDPANDWRIVVTDPFGAPSFIAPPLVMFAGADMEGVGVAGLARCVSHGDGGDSCFGVWSPRNGSDLISVPTGSDVTVRLDDGWQIGQASVKAALRESVRRDPIGLVEHDVASFEEGGDRLTIPLTGLQPGEYIVRVTLNATKGSDSFGGYYDIPVIIGG